MPKKYLKKDVLEASKERIAFVFDNFNKIYLSFSGGKDSSVMFHLVMDECAQRDRRIGVLFIDLEGQYKMTIEHIREMLKLYENYIDVYWVCLPIVLRNAVSVYEPRWMCWDDQKKDIWVRPLPDEGIHDKKYFPFFREGMEFEEFVPEFGKWYSNGEPTACFIGIRTSESYNRYLKLKVKKNREFFKKNMWLLKQKSTGMDIYSCHPIYDWETRDIWIYNGRFEKKYNKLYDIMHKAGLSIHEQRICQPYGEEQRKGLYLFQVIEPDTWSKLLTRVNGANSGAEFVRYSGNSSGTIKITKPDGHTWKSFASILLKSMPEKMKEHYANKIHVFLRWYEEKGWTNEKGHRCTGEIPDQADRCLESKKKIPSWRRICKMMLRNDYWGKTIGFVQNKDGYFYKKYMNRIKKDREKRKMENYKRAGNWRGFM